jgi:prolyl-tRNA synthetase
MKSYRDLPKIIYQVQTKFRDEPRPRAGLLRCREFTMKDAYSFDVDEPAALASYEVMRLAYRRIFDRIGLDYRMVSADSGAIATAGDPPQGENPKTSELHALKKVPTPGKRTIEEVSAFLDKPANRFLKSLVYIATSGTETAVVLAIVRGDHELNEVKLARALGASEVRMADAETVKKATGADVGFAGPVGYKGRIVVDRAAADVQGGVSGANETDQHNVNVVFGRDYEGEVADLRSVVAGDACPKCGKKLALFRGIEAGHIFVLGTKYSATMGATFLDKDGTNKPMVMGCYGIGVSRLVAATVEQHHDENGIVWPMSVAPYPVHIVQVGSEPNVVEAVAKLESELASRGIEALVDDRDERPGVKFKDADLIGMPLRVTIGAKALANGAVELKPRTEKNPKNIELLPVAEAAARLAERIRAGARP